MDTRTAADPAGEQIMDNVIREPTLKEMLDDPIVQFRCGGTTSAQTMRGALFMKSGRQIGIKVNTALATAFRQTA